MDFLIPKYRRDPNEKVEAIYSGIGPGGRTVTRVTRPSLDGKRMERTVTYGSPMPLERGQGGRVAVLVIGGMETTLDEMEYLVEAAKQKKWEQRRTSNEIVAMCRELAERRNALVKHLRANPSERPKKTPRKPLYLPVGYRFVPTTTPGMKVLARV